MHLPLLSGSDVCEMLYSQKEGWASAYLPKLLKPCFGSFQKVKNRHYLLPAHLTGPKERMVGPLRCPSRNGINVFPLFGTGGIQ